jgi:hypothetical protein
MESVQCRLAGREKRRGQATDELTTARGACFLERVGPLGLVGVARLGRGTFCQPDMNFCLCDCSTHEFRSMGSWSTSHAEKFHPSPDT